MCCNSLKEKMLVELQGSLKEKRGLIPFTKNRRHFEGWLQVELCEILVKTEENVIPEYSGKSSGNPDIVFDSREGGHEYKCAIELKVIPSRVECVGVNPPKNGDHVAQDLKSVLNDIKKLKNFPNCDTRMIIFFVYPVDCNTKETDNDNAWIIGNSDDSRGYFDKIKKEMELQGEKPFLKKVVEFNNIKGIIFLGTIRTTVV